MDLNFFIRGTGTSGDGVLIKLDRRLGPSRETEACGEGGRGVNIGAGRQP